jgi:hypothetical protein
MRGRNAGMAAGSRDRHPSVEISLLSDTGYGNDRTPHFGVPDYERISVSYRQPSSQCSPPSSTRSAKESSPYVCNIAWDRL